MITLANLLRPVRGFLITAAILSAAYAVASALGLREQTAFLSGTYVGDVVTSPILGTLYLALYVAWTVVVPILVIAAGIQIVIAKWNFRNATDRREQTSGSPTC